MAGRIRTTKKLSQRINREYFKRLYTIPRWRRILSFGLSIIGLTWVSWSIFAGSGAVFNAGPLSNKHHILEGNCASCHTASSSFGSKVEDQSCVSCHDGPRHQEQAASSPSCMSCHVEHRGSVALASVADSNCTQCHAALTTKSGTAKVDANIEGFDATHPEFRLVAEKAADPGTIKFGHAVHMKSDLRGPDGPVQLECSTCHSVKKAGDQPLAMTTATFKDHCESCHRLEFSKKIQEVLPHDTPEVALAFARDAFRTYIMSHPGDVFVLDPAVDPRANMIPRQPAGNAANWIAQRMEETERLMERKTCIECHALRAPTESSRTRNAFPKVAKSQITTHWLDKAKFDHTAHQLVSCASCHESAATSKETSDVLVPGIATCQQCHRADNPSASANCAECHSYHDWSQAKPIDSKRTIDQLLKF